MISQCKYITEVVSAFSDEQKQAVREIGFGCLLDLGDIDIKDDLFLPFLLNYNGSAMSFSNGKETVLINSTTIRDVLGLPLTDRKVEMEVFVRKSVSEDRVKWNKFIGARNSSHYLGKDHWKSLFTTYPSGDSFKQLFVMYSMTMFLCTRTDGCPSISYCPSLNKADEIATYNWSGYVANYLCDGVRKLHESLLSRKKTESKKNLETKLNVKGCMLALVLAVVHKFKVRDMDFSKAPTPYILFWREGSKLADVARVFGLNVKSTVLAVDVSALARSVLGHDVSTIDRTFKMVSKKRVHEEDRTTPKVVQNSPVLSMGQGDSGRELILRLPSHLKTDAEIDAEDVPVSCFLIFL